MLRSILGPAAVTMIGFAATIGYANAQEAPPEEDFMAEEGMMEPEPMPAPEMMEDTAEKGPAARVKGFVATRPVSCGEFKYWDGKQCADARDKKPAEP